MPNSYSLARRLQGSPPPPSAARLVRHRVAEPMPVPPEPETATLVRVVADEVMVELERRRAPSLSDAPPVPKLNGTPPRAFGLPDPWRFRLPINPRFRPYSQVNYDTLRWLARTCDIVASCVAYLKEQTLQAPRRIVPLDDKDDSKETRQQIKLATQFMGASGGLGGAGESRLSFEGKVLDDLIVVGVTAILHGYDTLGQRRDQDSQRVVAIDATCIEPMVTEYGFAPDIGAPAYRQWVLGVPQGTYARDEMEYRGLPLYERTDSPYPRCAVEDAVLCIWQIMQSDEWNRAFFKDGNTPDTWMKMPENMTPGDAKEWQTFIDDLMSGDSRTRRKLKITPGDIQSLANARDMEFSKLLSASRDRICIACGVQPAALGHIQQTYKSAQEPAMTASREGRVAQLLLWLNEWYTDLFRRKGWDAIQCTDEETNAEDATARATRHQIEIGSGQRTPRECRMEDGIDTSDDPKEAKLLYIQSALVPLTQAAAPPQPGVGPDGKPLPGQGGVTGQEPPDGSNADQGAAPPPEPGQKSGEPDYRAKLGRADVSNEARDAKGEWSSIGSGHNGKPSVSDDPEKWKSKSKSFKADEARGKRPAKSFDFKDYKIHWFPGMEHEGDLIAVDANKNVVGDVFFDSEGMPSGKMEGAVEVDPRHRRKGIATKLYQLGEQLTGKKAVPAPEHTDAAEAFWNQSSRPFGRVDAGFLFQRGAAHDFSCVIVVPNPTVQQRVIDWAEQHISPAILAEKGWETDPHITVRHGLHTNDANDVAAIYQGFGRITATGGPLDIFKADGYDVLIQSMHSPELERLNTRLGELEHTDTHTYRPHLTIAYVQPGAADKIALGPGPLDGERLTFDSVRFCGKTGQEFSIDEAGNADALRADLARWERKALNRLSDKGRAACAFESVAIAPDAAAAIGAALERCVSKVEVQELFRRFNPDEVRDWHGRFADGGDSRMAKKGAMRPGTKEDRARLLAQHKLNIPATYHDLKVTDNPDAELLATAKNDKGKVQPYYHPDYARSQAAAKFVRVKKLHDAMPEIRRKIDAEIESNGKNAHQALALRLIAQTGFRNGGEGGGGDAEAFGASNLKTEHVTTDGDTLRFDFPGKGGHRQQHSLVDPVLASHVRQRQADGHERVFETNDAKTRDYLQKVSGDKFKVHDLRTRVATGTASHYIDVLERADKLPTSEKEFTRVRNTIGDKVAKAIGDTRAVAISSYVAAQVWEALRQNVK